MLLKFGQQLALTVGNTTLDQNALDNLRHSIAISSRREYEIDNATREYAEQTIARSLQKLESVSPQAFVEAIVTESTDMQRLEKMYQGWNAWL